MVELVRLLPRYLVALLAIAGYLLSLFFIAGWAWFRAYFGALGLDVDSYDGVFSKIEAYVPEGVESFQDLLSGQFREEFAVFYRESILEGPFIYPIMATLLFFMIYLILAIFFDIDKNNNVENITGTGSITTPTNRRLIVDMTAYKAAASSYDSKIGRSLQGALQFIVISTLISAGVLSIKSGQWRGENSASMIPHTDFPRIQILFKQGTSSSRIKGLENRTLRKIFSDKTNIYAYAESEGKPGLLPPIYIIAINEISQLWVLKSPAPNPARK